MARPARAKLQLDQRASPLHRSPDGAPKVEPASVRAPQPASQSHAKSPSQWFQNVKRGIKVHFTEFGEWLLFEFTLAFDSPALARIQFPDLLLAKLLVSSERLFARCLF